MKTISLYKAARHSLLLPLGITLLAGCNSLDFNLDNLTSATPSATATPAPPLTLQTSSISIPASIQFLVSHPTFDVSAQSTIRFGHKGVLLHTGSGATAKEVVFVTGGDDHTAIISSCLSYDPSTNTWKGELPMSSIRTGHSASVIKIGSDHHEAILVVGGFHNDPLDPWATAEIYDPVGGAGNTPIWKSAGSLSVPRGNHTATVLSNGNVLITAGSNDYYTRPGSELASAEIYNPSTNTWSVTASLATARASHSASLVKIGADLHDGVLVVAGSDITGSAFSSAELYDVQTGTWTPAGNIPNNASSISAVVLADGSVLVSGGQGNAYEKYSDSQIYVPSHTGTVSTTWTPTGGLRSGRYQHTSLLLPNGNVFVTGGYSGGGAETTAELYNTSGGSWSNPADTVIAREEHTTTLLSDGRVVVFSGGDNASNMSMTEAGGTEIFQTYALTTPVPTSGIAPYTYQLTSGTGTVYSNGTYVPNQFTAETATIQITDSVGSSAVYTVTTTP